MEIGEFKEKGLWSLERLQSKENLETLENLENPDILNLLAANSRRYSFIVSRKSEKFKTLTNCRQSRVSGKPRKLIEPGVFRNLKGLKESIISTECQV